MYDNISKDNNSKFPKSPNPYSYRGFGNGVESVRTVLRYVQHFLNPSSFFLTADRTMDGNYIKDDYLMTKNLSFQLDLFKIYRKLYFSLITLKRLFMFFDKEYTNTHIM